MTFSIPSVDQLGWGEPLKNHLAQLNDPDTGGLIHVLNVAERDSRFWPNGATDKDEYANKTVYVTATGTFHVWTISTGSANSRYWRELGKDITSQGWEYQPGTVEGYGYELRGTGTSFTRMKVGDHIRIDNLFYKIHSISNDTTLMLTDPAYYEVVAGGSTIGNWRDYPTFEVLSVVGNTVTFNGPVSTIGAKVGDTFVAYGRTPKSLEEGQQSYIVTAISGNTLSVNGNAMNGYNSPFWILYRSILPNNTFESQGYLQSWNDGEKDRVIFYPNGSNVFNGTLTLADPDLPNRSAYLSYGSIATYIEDDEDPDIRHGFTMSVSRIANTQGPKGHCEIYGTGNRFQVWGFSDIWLGAFGKWGAAMVITGINSDSPTSTGKVGIGTLTPTEKLHVVGNILATGTITQGSDKRWKEDIVKIDSALEKISLLEGVTYHWKDKEVRGADRQIGLIAQDVEKAFPEAVKKDNEGYMSVNYNGLVGALVEGIKELKDIIQTLNERIITLEAK